MEIINSAHSYINLDVKSVKYGTQDTSAYTTNNYYPTIYANEKLSVINGVKNTTGLGMSEQNEYYTGSTQPKEAEDGTKSIQPYQTYWNMNEADMKEYLGGETSVNYELIMPKQNNTSYWIASRCIFIFSQDKYCDFDVRRVANGKVGAYDVKDVDVDYLGNTISIRPIVSLSSDLLTQEEDGTWSVK